MSTSSLAGIFVPNIVPYDAQGRIHEEELRRIIRWQEWLIRASDSGL